MILQAVTYLSVLISYLKYFRDEIDRINEEIGYLLNKIRNWKGAFRSKVVKNNDYSNISIEQLQSFQKSEVVKNFIKSLLLLKGNKGDLQMNQHTQIRNVILMLILLRNSNRSGVLCNMLISEFQNSQKIDTHYVVQVEEHKSKGEHGPAEIVLSADLQEFICLYMSKIRNIILEKLNIVNNYVFITWSGKKLTSGDVFANIKRIWNIAGFSSPIGSSRIRHTLTKLIHETDKENAVNVANHLCHRPSTAEIFYKKKGKGDRSVKTALVIQKGLTGKEIDMRQENLNEEIIQEENDSQTQSVRSIVAESTDGRGRKTFTNFERNIII